MADEVKDEKYIVFKRSDWDKFITNLTAGYSVVTPDRVDDAVVIRTRDIYAGPALHAYAHAAMTTMEFLTPEHPEREGIGKVVDYFIDRANEADIIRFHHRSQTPKAP